jgi:hypothetical protein
MLKTALAHESGDPGVPVPFKEKKPRVEKSRENVSLKQYGAGNCFKKTFLETL